MAAKYCSRAFSKLVPNPSLQDQIRKSYFTLFQQSPIMAPFVRLAWHDAGTFDKNDTSNKSGGPKGTIRFTQVLDHGANKGLSAFIPLIEAKKVEFPQVSYSDLIQLSSISGIEFAGGPAIPFRFGRPDATQDQCPPEGRLPDATKGIPHLREVFYRMGLKDVDIVALSGAHTLGKAWRQNSGFEGPWTVNPAVFDNSYFVELVHKRNNGLLRLPTDEALLGEPKMKKWVAKFAESKEEFFKEYVKAHTKLSELGFK